MEKILRELFGHFPSTSRPRDSPTSPPTPQEKFKKGHFRKGMVLLNNLNLEPVAFREFEAEIIILHHSTTIRNRYQAVIHCGVIRQSAEVLAMSSDLLRTGDKATIRFRFLYHVEYIKPGRTLLFREGRTKGIGKITKVSVEVCPLLSSMPACLYATVREFLPVFFFRRTMIVTDCDHSAPLEERRSRGRGYAKVVVLEDLRSSPPSYYISFPQVIPFSQTADPCEPNPNLKRNPTPHAVVVRAERVAAEAPKSSPKSSAAPKSSAKSSSPTK